LKFRGFNLTPPQPSATMGPCTNRIGSAHGHPTPYSLSTLH
jgi:hypothetical protein